MRFAAECTALDDDIGTSLRGAGAGRRGIPETSYAAPLIERGSTSVLFACFSAFVATKSGKKEIYTADVDGSNVVQLTHDGPRLVRAGAIAWERVLKFVQ